jgi:hypothetical protein
MHKLIGYQFTSSAFDQDKNTKTKAKVYDPRLPGIFQVRYSHELAKYKIMSNTS